MAGSTVNTPFLAALAADADFAAGDVDTGLIARNQAELTTLPAPELRHVATAALAAADVRTSPGSSDPWDALAGYAHFHAPEKLVELAQGGEAFFSTHLVYGQRKRARATRRPKASPCRHPPLIMSPAGRVMSAFLRACMPTISPSPTPFAQAEAALAGGDAIRAPMPGLVKIVRVAGGDKVAKGPAAAGAGSHEDGARPDGVARRHRRAKFVPEGRSGHGRAPCLSASRRK